MKILHTTLNSSTAFLHQTELKLIFKKGMNWIFRAGQFHAERIENVTFDDLGSLFWKSEIITIKLYRACQLFLYSLYNSDDGNMIKDLKISCPSIGFKGEAFLKSYTADSIPESSILFNCKLECIVSLSEGIIKGG